MAQKDPSRTEQATPKRVNKARKEGSVPKSAELSKLVVLLAGMLVIRYTFFLYEREMSGLFTWFLGQGMRTELTQSSVYRMLIDISMSLAKMLLPTLFILAATAYLVMRYQVGKLWVSKIFSPDFSKCFQPMAGLKRLLLDPKALVRLARQVAQAAAIGVAPYLVLKKEFGNIMPLFYNNATGLAAYILGTAYTMLWYAIVPMFLIAVFDLWYTRWDYAQQLKMTKAEVKDEARNAEGDPEVKKRQRAKMFEVMGKRMMKNVPKADVIITNPTHLAVAIQYNVQVAPAPIVVAKGAGHLAERIKEIAREHNVPIRENKPLARALYKDVEIGEAIPEALYQAVAAVLAQLSRFRNRGPR